MPPTDPFKLLLTAIAVFLTAALALPGLAQTGPGGMRPPLSEGADWFDQLVYALPYAPGSDAQGAAGDRLERFSGSSPDGQELILMRSEYATLFVQKLGELQTDGQLLASNRNDEKGYRRDILLLQNGKVRAIDSWMSPPAFFRMAVATAQDEPAALDLLARVEKLREKGGFGGQPLLHTPSVATP